eukprot:67772-Chlamydomonas_euryale.AAC.3
MGGEQRARIGGHAWATHGRARMGGEPARTHTCVARYHAALCLVAAALSHRALCRPCYACIQQVFRACLWFPLSRFMAVSLALGDLSYT